MLNRRHIRLKVMQVLYANHLTDNNQTETALIAQFDSNVNNMYRLYLYELLYLKEIYEFVEIYDSEIRNRLVESARSTISHLKLRENQLLAKIANSSALVDACKKEKIIWSTVNDDDAIRKIFLDFKNSDRHEDLQQLPGNEEFWGETLLHFVKYYSDTSDLLESHLEEEFTNYQDDQKLVFSMLKKTIQNLKEGKDEFLVEFVQDWDNTIGFGHELIKNVVKHQEEVTQLANAKITKWEPGQVAIIDTVLLKMGIAEFKYFISIPSTVTINEYVELAKSYSPVKSRKFINGVLDAISKELEAQ